MHLHKIEGIILQAIKYQEHDQILTLFTLDNGLIKIFSSGATLTKGNLRGINLSLSQVEIIYLESRSDLHKCKEITMLCPHLHLRQSGEKLNSILEMVKVILKSQLPHKPAPHLYKLLVYYIDKLKENSNADLLEASFRMKVLKHEGLLNLNSTCSSCSSPLNNLSLYEGESYCQEHAPSRALLFTEEEALQLYLLAHTRSFIELTSLDLTSSLKEKISQLCENL